ncbi:MULTISPECIES: AMP-binding protein [Burkholderiaceae]|uniref:Acetyl-coenzyme A synthetase n=2 Tax=Caballeronia TaxID=1827195 RepID=A0A242MKY0_CABSO|nr:MULTISPECIES: AMP-binding protein [Burkholderiaceae]AME23375.1 AMP-dependent synthetase [Burkholderia sp. PAMC 26561]OTP71623.1 Acetyl-coenzyme A synthetase [Caballeronia sordidicola]
MASQGFLQARDFLLRHRDDYATAYRDFAWPELTEFNWALDWFDEYARSNMNPALWVVEDNGDEIKLSYAELSARSNQLANWLRQQGVQRGDRILLMLPNQPALWETMLAAMKLGAVTIPATMLLTPADIADRMTRGEVKHVIVASNETAKFDAIDKTKTRIAVAIPSSAALPEGWLNFADAFNESPSFEPEGRTLATDPLLLYFTSGTTSRPKLVLHSHQSYPVGHLSTMYWIGLKPGDVHLNISSPGWAKHAWSCVFAPWNAGATVFIHNTPRFSAKSTLEALVKNQVTTLCAPPTVWRMMIQEDLSAYKVHLREVVGAGEPLNPEIIERVRKAWNLTLRDGFGQTETTAQIANSPGQPMKAGSMGRPLPGYRITLLDHDDNPAQEGELALILDPKPLGLMDGYVDDASKTQDAMRGGHYRTGDVASIDADGYFTYVGRADDVFKAADYRISPFELESVLIEHPAVGEAAVVPSPDPLRLSVPKAFVALRNGYEPTKETAGEILKFAAQKLAAYKRIRRIEFYELPKTISGKIRRVELRKTEEARGSDARRDNEYWEEDFNA